MKKYILIAGLLLANILYLIYFDTAALDLIKFTAVIIGATLIPGLLLIEFTSTYRDTMYRYPLALACGICIDIILNILFSAWDIKSLLYIMFILIDIIYLWRKTINRDVKLFQKLILDFDNRYFSVLALLALTVPLLISIMYFIPNHLPGGEASLIYYIDHPWHLGNIAEIKHHWYPDDPRLSGNPFHYHVFLYVYLAMISFLGNIDIPVLYFRLYMPFLIYLLFAGAYFSCSRWAGSRAAGLAGIPVFLVFGTFLFSFPGNLFLKDLFLSPTMLLAVVLMIFLLNEINIFLAGKEKGNFFIIILLTAGVSGAKGSFFPVIFSGILLVLLYTCIKRNFLKRVLILAGSTFTIFFLAFIYIYHGAGSEGINIIPLEIIRRTDLFQAYLSLLGQDESLFLMLAFLPIYFLAFFGFRGLALIHLLKTILTPLKTIPLERLFMAGTILASFIPAYFLDYRGSSQYFYLFAGYTALNIAAAGYIFEIYKNRRKAPMLLLLILLLTASFDTGVTIKEYNKTFTLLQEFTNKPLTPSLYEGLSFLRDNTDENIVVASYRSFWLSEENPRFFIYSAFSERRMLVEGWQYMSEKYRAEALERHEAMKVLYSTRDADTAEDIISKYGIDYILVDLDKSQKLRFNQKSILDLVYTNSKINIYQVVN